MFVWNVEEMRLSRDISRVNGEEIFTCEKTTSTFEKSAFVDSKTSGGMTILLNIIHKFEEEKESLPKTKNGYYRISTIREWLKKKKFDIAGSSISLNYDNGTYTFLDVRRNIIYGENHLSDGDTYENIIDECFHRLLLICETEEKRYFEKNDEYSSLKNDFMSFYNTYRTTFGLPLYFNDEGDIMLSMKTEDRKLKMAELKTMVKRYEALQSRDFDLTKQTIAAFKSKVPNIAFDC